MNDFRAILEYRVRQLDGLPASAAVALRVIALARQRNVDRSEFVRLVDSDPGLSSKVLALTNSAWFGLSRQVKTVDRALALLGPTNVRALAVSYCMAALHSNWKLDPADSRAYWEASLAKAVVARRVMSVLQPEQSDEAFAAGLLQDMALGFCVEVGGRPSSDLLLDDAVSVEEQLAHERSITGFDHARGGRMVAALIRLPEPYLSAISAHHSALPSGPLKDDPQFMLAIRAAALFPHDVRHWRSDDRLALDELVRAKLSAHWANAAGFVECAHREFEQLRRLLGCDDIEAPSLPELLEMAATENARHTATLIAELQTTKADQGRLAGLVDELAEQRDSAEQRATRDPLTGLLNRGGFCERADTLLKEAAAGHSPVAVALLDLDRFKQINDQHGHICGDAVLQSVSRRLAAACRSGELLCRWGGDEIVVLWVGMKHADCAQAAQRLRDAITSAPIAWNGLKLDVSLSIGVSWVESLANPHVFDQLLEEADGGLYEAKQRRQYVVMRTASQTQGPVTQGA